MSDKIEKTFKPLIEMAAGVLASVLFNSKGSSDFTRSPSIALRLLARPEAAQECCRHINLAVSCLVLHQLDSGWTWHPRVALQ